jgi:hypothetical protein
VSDGVALPAPVSRVAVAVASWPTAGTRLPVPAVGVKTKLPRTGVPLVATVTF